MGGGRGGVYSNLCQPTCIYHLPGTGSSIIKQDEQVRGKGRGRGGGGGGGESVRKMEESSS